MSASCRPRAIFIEVRILLVAYTRDTALNLCHRERSDAIQSRGVRLDCFAALAMTACAEYYASRWADLSCDIVKTRARMSPHPCQTKNRHTPRRRGVQYAAAHL